MLVEAIDWKFTTEYYQHFIDNYTKFSQITPDHSEIYVDIDGAYLLVDETLNTTSTTFAGYRFNDYIKLNACAPGKETHLSYRALVNLYNTGPYDSLQCACASIVAHSPLGNSLVFRFVRYLNNVYKFQIIYSTQTAFAYFAYGDPEHADVASSNTVLYDSGLLSGIPQITCLRLELYTASYMGNTYLRCLYAFNEDEEFVSTDQIIYTDNEPLDVYNFYSYFTLWSLQSYAGYTGVYSVEMKS